jgi:hypothetical protein
MSSSSSSETAFAFLFGPVDVLRFLIGRSGSSLVSLSSFISDSSSDGVGAFAGRFFLLLLPFLGAGLAFCLGAGATS